MNKTFHWRSIDKSKSLQMLLEILKDADRPLSGLDMQELSRPYVGGTPRLVNCITLCHEIDNNPGYRIGGGMAFGRFPDGLFKYWLEEAPGWRRRWIVTRDFKVKLHFSGFHDDQDPVEQRQAPDNILPNDILLCPNPACQKPLPAGLAFCDDICKKSYFTAIQGKLTF